MVHLDTGKTQATTILATAHLDCLWRDVLDSVLRLAQLGTASNAGLGYARRLIWIAPGGRCRAQSEVLGYAARDGNGAQTVSDVAS